MTEVTTAELRNNLSTYIWQVNQTREPLTITSYGRPVAVLAPPTCSGVAVADGGEKNSL